MGTEMQHYLVTERPMGPRESRVCQEIVRLRDAADAQVISAALMRGTLRLRPGVRAWTECTGSPVPASPREVFGWD